MDIRAEDILSWNLQTNCITEWRVPGWSKPLRFTGWGLETSDGFGFFAQEYLGGFRFHIEKHQLGPVQDGQLGSSWWIKLPKAHLHFQTLDKLMSPTCMVRHLRVENNGSGISWLLDAVLRLVVPWEEGLVAEFEGGELDHRNSNFYYETEESTLALRWPHGRRLLVRWLKPPEVPLAFTPYLYVRDQPSMPQYLHSHCSTPAWIIHARTLVDYPAALTFHLWRDFALWSRGFLGRAFFKRRHIRRLWRAGEWHPGTRWNLFGLWPLLPGQSLSLSIQIDAT